MYIFHERQFISWRGKRRHRQVERKTECLLDEQQLYGLQMLLFAQFALCVFQHRAPTSLLKPHSPRSLYLLSSTNAPAVDDYIDHRPSNIIVRPFRWRVARNGSTPPIK